MNQIRHISTSNVGPTCELTRRSIELTPWDLQCLEIDYIQKGILFNKPVEEEHSNGLVQHLKASLSLALNVFYPLAGRLAVTENEDKTTTCISIDCNGAGSHFVHAAGDGVKVAEVLNPVYIHDQVVCNLFPLNAVRCYEGVSKPLLAVQVTELVDGIFIGCSINHVAADGTSFWHFLNTWSEIARTGTGSDIISQPRPVFGRHEFYDGLIDLPIRLPFPCNEIMSKQHMAAPPSDSSRRAVFHFSKEKVAELKAKANAEMGTNNISSLQSLMAHIWRATTRGRRLHPNQEVSYLIAAGLRQRFKQMLPKEYFGNAVLGVNVRSTAGELMQHGLGWAASQINKAIASLTPEQVSKSLENWVKAPTFLSTLWDPKSVVLFTGSSPQFNVYGNDFGWGRPVAVLCGASNNMNGKFTVFPGAEEGSIDFEACLLPETLQAILDDAEFMDSVIT